MNITDYITRNGGFISSTEAKKASLYNELLEGTRSGEIVRVRQGIYALNEGLSKQMIDVETVVPGGVLCPATMLTPSPTVGALIRERLLPCWETMR